MEDRVIIHAYRHLFQKGLQAVRHAPPARNVLRGQLRSSFRSGDRSDFDPEKIARTLEFLDRAAESNSYEHKIIKNLLHVRYFEQPSMRKSDIIYSLATLCTIKHYTRTCAILSYCLNALMSDYISSLLIEPIVRHARRLSPHSAESPEVVVPTASGNHDLEPDFPDTSLQKINSHDSPPVALPTFLDTDLECTRRRLVACRPSADDDLRGTMDDSDSEKPGDSEDSQILQSHQVASTYSRQNTEEVSAPAIATATSDAVSGRHDDNLPLRELPEDDGMTELRTKIHAIRDNDASGIQKARLIHSLMIESYQAARKTFSERQIPSQSPSSVRSREHSPISSSSPRTRRSIDRLSLDSSEQRTATPDRIYYNLSPEDLQPTFAPKDVDSGEPPAAGSGPTTEADDNISNDDYSDEDILVLGCQHYKRNVKLQCYTCKKWYTCRFCHDETEDHALERRKTENMLCMLCGVPQPAAQWCKECVRKAYIIAMIVAFAVLDKELGRIFITARCGHSIHQKCYDEFSKNSYKCPICSKSIMNMEARFRNLDRTIESQPMPIEFEDTRALVYCNDCGAKSDVPYHWLGLKCDLCESYNTAQLRLLSGADDMNEPDLISRPRVVPISIPDHSYEPLSATSLVNEAIAEPELRWRPSTATSADGRPIASRQRAVSPTVGNYFELSRDTTWAASIFSRRRSEGGNEDEEPGFWATSPLRKYTFFGSHDGSSGDESESDFGSVTTEELEDDDDLGLEEDDEDEIDPIEIFGHR
ncbi:hypothetical protein UA08_04355 [Talaromyces atroroseus]|uniref:CHY-type domain-containing protein n=1 Tax=Talaromyces atroroseus TaxID=1441469 RepID=A0A1Q5Q8Y2_TALAT|nr:hypothetical protein UA08_04355 [Talaromyces atroroseus]OKL60593.1 hypothetical protein UA08_04355 [Talaromyces atroroseus]